MRQAFQIAGIFCMSGLACLADAAERDYPIRPVPLTSVRATDDFWRPRIQTNRDVTVWYDFRKCEETGRIDNFAVAGGLKQGGFQGIFYNDSDVYKIIEGAAYCLATHPDPRLQQYVDNLIDIIAAAQEDDGYLYTARTINDPNYDYPGKEARWSHLGSGHELYNIGHLYEAAVAYWQATGKRKLLDVAIRSADLVCREFGPGPGQRIGVPGHEEIEIGLVKLYRATGQRKYLDQARFFIDMRGRQDLRQIFGLYAQDHLPVLEQSEAVGHAVRAGYLYAGMADVATLTGQPEYVQAIDRIWTDIVSRKMYITGGVGASRSGEAFGRAYELPNETAYNETCAAIAMALLNHRMFLLHGDARYIDVLERIIYNGFLAGVSLDGDRFFYPNPLACDGRTKFNQGTLGRSPWFDCSCCPVNVVRFVPAIPGYVYAVRDQDLYVNLFMGCEATIPIGSRQVRCVQSTAYPWDGRVVLKVEPDAVCEFTLRVRIPGWVRGEPMPSDLYRYLDDKPLDWSESAPEGWLTINGTPPDRLEFEKGYAVIRRQWQPGDQVRLNWPMPVRRVVAHDQVAACAGRVAIERGPVVYCLEAVDHGGQVSDLYLPDDQPLEAHMRDDLLGGVMVIQATARRALPAQSDEPQQSEPVALTAIPYYAWAHRQIGPMTVWIPRSANHSRPRPAPTLASTSRATASHCWQADSVEAIQDQLVPQSSSDHSIPRHTWWDHRGTREWVQYEFPQPTRVSTVEVYWFDDTGIGRCRVPQSWRVLYRDAQGEWREVESQDEPGVAKDTMNRVRFEPVTTDGLRLEVQLQPEWSGGILEWRVE